MNEKRQAIKYLLNAIGERYWEFDIRKRLIMIKLVIIRTKKRSYDYQREKRLC